MSKEQKRIRKRHGWETMTGMTALTVCLAASDALAAYSEKAAAVSVDQNNAVIAAVAAVIAGVLAFASRHRADR